MPETHSTWAETPAAAAIAARAKTVFIVGCGVVVVVVVMEGDELVVDGCSRARDLLLISFPEQPAAALRSPVPHLAWHQRPESESQQAAIH